MFYCRLFVWKCIGEICLNLRLNLKIEKRVRNEANFSTKWRYIYICSTLVKSKFNVVHWNTVTLIYTCETRPETIKKILFRDKVSGNFQNSLNKIDSYNIFVWLNKNYIGINLDNWLKLLHYSHSEEKFRTDISSKCTGLFKIPS